ncbi:unnamed protein product [Choristocarpus tenellus]
MAFVCAMLYQDGVCVIRRRLFRCFDGVSVMKSDKSDQVHVWQVVEIEYWMLIEAINNNNNNSSDNSYCDDTWIKHTLNTTHRIMSTNESNEVISSSATPEYPESQQLVLQHLGVLTKGSTQSSLPMIIIIMIMIMTYVLNGVNT